MSLTFQPSMHSVIWSKTSLSWAQQRRGFLRERFSRRMLRNRFSLWMLSKVIALEPYRSVCWTKMIHLSSECMDALGSNFQMEVNKFKFLNELVSGRRKVRHVYDSQMTLIIDFRRSGWWAKSFWATRRRRRFRIAWVIKVGSREICFNRNFHRFLTFYSPGRTSIPTSEKLRKLTRCWGRRAFSTSRKRMW